eukprot:m.276856 g.276856  ORF g.276856 m.276856 type:complete len:766 (+) comp15715_c0_seq1:118-2415(+)
MEMTMQCELVELGEVLGEPCSFPERERVDPSWKAGDRAAVVTVTPPELLERPKAHIMCVVDVSGSMTRDAVVKDAQGEEKSFKKSYLDVVVHAVTMVLESLGPGDLFSLITFAQEAKPIVIAKDVTETSKREIKKKLSQVQANGATQMWAAIQMALEQVYLVRQRTEPNVPLDGPLPGKGFVEGMEAMSQLSRERKRRIMLFTDGVPDSSEQTFVEGLAALKQTYKESDARNFPCPIDTFGFGYVLNSKLLRKISTETHGRYSFIPDSGLIGTVFVHAMANTLSTVVPFAQVELRCSDAEHMPHIFDSQPVPALHSEQPFTMVVRIPPGFNVISAALRLQDNPCGNAAQHYELCSTPCEAQEFCEPENLSTGAQMAVVKEIALHRVQQCFDAACAIRPPLPTNFSDDSLQVSRGDEHTPLLQKDLVAVCDYLDECEFSEEEEIQGLIKDIEEQVQGGVSRLDYFQRWGRHYTPSWLAAHRGLYCNNFKDTGLQHYGGRLFRELRERGDDLFKTLPPPARVNPIAAYDRQLGGAHMQAGAHHAGPDLSALEGLVSALGIGAAPPQPSMAEFHNPQGGCFTGESLVSMADGTHRRVKDIVPGDAVLVPVTPGVCRTETVARVKYCVKVIAASGQMDVVSLSSTMAVTPFHPVCVDGEWRFPATLCPPTTLACDAVYDFVLESGHSMVIGGVSCITLGHNNTSSTVVAHPFFGTDAVVHALEQHPSLSDGHIEVVSSEFVRVPALDSAQQTDSLPLVSGLCTPVAAQS